MLYMYVSSVLINLWMWNMGVSECLCLESTYLLPGYEKNVSSKIPNIPSIKVECGGHPKYVQRKLAICSTHIIVSFKHVTKNCYENITKITGKKWLSMKWT